MNLLKEFDLGFHTTKNFMLAGIDEAGRGPLAGPVVAACVVFDKNTSISLINDSKKLPEKLREELFPQITEKTISYGIGVVDNFEIDKINILQATFEAMKIALDQIDCVPDKILIDGNQLFDKSKRFQSVVKGDGKSFSIAAASILAKVTRDRIMIEASEEFPNYNWNKNKGYATKEHINSIRKYGACRLHRLSFLKRILPSEEIRELELDFNE
ncbi:MAG: ribonuclease HII [Melioribacteraceae bacterium]|nr:ribonuclease HII [Melioribacteraceae bacterium]